MENKLKHVAVPSSEITPKSLYLSRRDWLKAAGIVSAAAGLIDLVRRGFFRKEDTVLFWHTGGQPALFAEQYAPFLGD